MSWPDGDDDRLGEFSPTAHTSEVLAAYQTDNLLDASHFPFLHRSLSTRNPLIGEQEIVDQHDLGFSTVQRKLADDNASTEGWLRYTCAAPFTVLLRSEEPDGALAAVVLPGDSADRRAANADVLHGARSRNRSALSWPSCLLKKRSCNRKTCGSPRPFAVAACRCRRAGSSRALRRKRDPLSARDAPPLRRPRRDCRTNEHAALVRGSSARGGVVRSWCPEASRPSRARRGGSRPARRSSTSGCAARAGRTTACRIRRRVRSPGRFEIADGEARWHVELDTDGVVPRTDRAACDRACSSPTMTRC